MGWDGDLYVLDLTTEHAKELRELVQPYIDAAHNKVRIAKKLLPKNDALPDEIKTPRAISGGSAAKANAVPDKELRSKIRQWGRENGYEVSERGILPRADSGVFQGA